MQSFACAFSDSRAVSWQVLVCRFKLGRGLLFGLVFLLAGPATNIGSLVVLLKVLGRRAVAAYLLAVIIMTLAAGFALNTIYRAWGLDPRATFGTAAVFVPDLVKDAGAAMLRGMEFDGTKSAKAAKELADKGMAP